ncbi:MAG: hypothetical protein R3E96_14125 [Planctomycetota bacterium]
MKLLNVLLFTVAGIGGLTFLQRTLAKWFQPSPAEAEGLDSGELSDAADSLAWRRRKGQEPSRTRRLFFGWCVLFGVVGAQMGWVLRPFLGDPGQPFALFRERESNILAQVLTSLGRLFQ